MTRAEIVAEARAWVGTPYHWQASVKGRGCDCKGLVAGVARELRLPEADSVYALMADYSLNVDSRLLKRGLAELFDRASTPQPGDVLLLRIGRPAKPQHLAIYTGGRMIHTYGRGPEQVVDVPFTHVWQCALDSVWSWRGVA